MSQTNCIVVQPPVVTGPDEPGWKLTHIEPTNGRGVAYDYFLCPKCAGLFVVPVEHQCVPLEHAGK